MLKSSENLRVKPLGRPFPQSSPFRPPPPGLQYTGLCRTRLPPKKAAEASAKGFGVPQTGAPILPLPDLRCMTKVSWLHLPEPVFYSEKWEL